MVPNTPEYVIFELLMHAAFVADEIWGFMPEPAGSTYKVISNNRNGSTAVGLFTYVRRDCHVLDRSKNKQKRQTRAPATPTASKASTNTPDTSTRTIHHKDGEFLDIAFMVFLSVAIAKV